MRRRVLSILILSLLIFSTFSKGQIEAFWGFHAHQIINKMAVMILPPPMMHFFKKNIDFIMLHSTDPDKRRYAVKGEAIKHYIDLDHWGTHPFEALPRNWTEALLKFTEIKAISKDHDTLIIKRAGDLPTEDSFFLADQWIYRSKFKDWIRRILSNDFHELPFSISVDSMNIILSTNFDPNEISHFLIDEIFTQHGISPFNIQKQFYFLRAAFQSKDESNILRIAADLGHYVADAHVPLHTTSNYNGQKSGQEGIHAFWESRLPELFAEEEYSYFVGKARYIENIQKFIWDIVLESHALHHSVLSIEKELSENFDAKQQFSYEDRLGRSIRVPSREYALSYHNNLQGMVEYRMQSAILALASIWFTAWVDAGQPNLNDSGKINWSAEDVQSWEDLNFSFSKGHSRGRTCK